MKRVYCIQIEMLLFKVNLKLKDIVFLDNFLSSKTQWCKVITLFYVHNKYILTVFHQTMLKGQFKN